jgi:prepilin-type N-terminal cleavage/methylation domain-containing protein
MKPYRQHQQGFSLLELVIGLFIFATGMLALASLQGQLTRSQADAAVRSVATNIAEEEIESMRGFGLIDDDPDSSIPAYSDIQDRSFTVSRGNMDYTVTIDVTDYYYDLVSDRFGTDNPDNLLVSDFKDVNINVSWGATPDFRISESQNISAVDIGTGNVQFNTLISSVTTQGSGRSTTQTEDESLLPSVSYTPGALPDIVSLRLGNSRFKESTSPVPRVYRSEEKVETRFDVITYSQTDAGATYLRREEFIGVSCECEMQAAPADIEQGGRLPTTWAADEYEKGELAIKPRGASTSSQQSIYCDECCRDHHDMTATSGDTAAALYDPFRSSGDYWDSGPFQGDHKHYGRSSSGQLVLAQAVGDHYLEACRMVRVDGFMRVGQDFRQEGRNAFPENYLDETSEVSDYSDWITTSTDLFENALSGDYESAPLTLPEAPKAPAAKGLPTTTTLPTTVGAVTQQLRSRGVYIDYMRDDLRTAIDCLRALPAGSVATDCDSDTIKFDKNDSINYLEIIPFFDVQLTWLNRWSENPANRPVDTTNEPVLTDNAHSRGVASNPSGSGTSTVYASGHRGNLGLTDTDPIDPNFNSWIGTAQLTVNALSSDPPPSPGNVVIRGVITSGVTGLRATDIEIEGSQAYCNRTPNGFACEFLSTSTDVTLKVYNYKKQGETLAACSPTLTTLSSGTDANGRGFTYFSLSPSPALDSAVSHDISIQSDSCG